jgi:hypothetical protein
MLPDPDTESNHLEGVACRQIHDDSNDRRKSQYTEWCDVQSTTLNRFGREIDGWIAA